MTQPIPTPTLSKWTLSDQRFAAGLESSPKNDISGSLLMSAHRQVKTRRSVVKNERMVKDPLSEVSSARIEMAQRLQHLKMFSRGKSSVQVSDAAELKRLGLCEAIKTQFPELGQRAFQRHDIYAFLLELDERIALGEWSLRESSQEVIVYARYGSVFPGLRFKKCGEAYHCKGFNFEIRLAS